MKMMVMAQALIMKKKVVNGLQQRTYISILVALLPYQLRRRLKLRKMSFLVFNL